MEKIMLYIILFCLTLLSAQEWTAPVNVSNQGGGTSMEDFFIDDTGVIHCVWSHGDINVLKVYYSKSTDNGQTWLPPVDISHNTEHRIIGPMIVVDSSHNIHVAYTYEYGAENHSNVYRECINNVWSSEFNLTPGLSWAGLWSLKIDHNDRIYALMYWDGYIRYRYQERGVWSDILQAYPDDGNTIILRRCVVGSNNDLHFVGVIRYPGDPVYTTGRIGYFKYEAELGVWYYPSDFGFNYSYFQTIDLDNQDCPRIYWNEQTASGTPLGMYYLECIDGFWLTPQLIMNIYADYPVIKIDDSGISHIIQRETVGTGENRQYSLIYYTNPDWNASIVVPPCNSVGSQQMLYYHNTLYLMYAGGDASGIQNIWLTKRNLSTAVNDNYQSDNVTDKYSFLSLYPNPFYQFTTISFTLPKSMKTDLSIYNLKGQKVRTLITGIQTSGKHSFVWDGTDAPGKKVTAGIYFSRLVTPGQVITTKLIILK